MTAEASALDRIGGEEAAHRLAQAFYARVLADPVLLPLFRDPAEPHAERMGWWLVAGGWWLVELFRGDRVHSARRGGFATMVRAHHSLRIGEAQRARWVAHMTAATEEVGLDPETVAGFAGYVEAASWLAMNGSREVAPDPKPAVRWLCVPRTRRAVLQGGATAPVPPRDEARCPVAAWLAVRSGRR